MFFETFLQDLRIGFRVLIKEKSFCALAVIVLAVGICAVTTQYAVVNGVLLRGFNFRSADRLVDAQFADPKDFSPANFNSRFTTADFVEVKAQAQSYDAMVAYLNGSTVNLTYQGQPKRLQGGYVTYDFFRTLGVSPTLGRDFLPEEDRPNVDKAVLLSDALWRSDFGANPDIVGQAVRVNGRAGTIVGVMPPKFSFPANEQVWLPVNAEFPVRPRADPNINSVSMIGRLKPGVSLEQAQAELTTIAGQFAKAYPDTNKPFTLGYVRPLIRAFTGGTLPGLLFTMLGFCVGVLLIACVNVMNMQFARATLRSKELAIRSALGASRWRLVRQMLTESLLVAVIGSAVGVTLAFYATDYLNALTHNLANPPPSWMVFSIDLPVLIFVVGITVFSALVSGFIPAWLSSRPTTVEVLKESGRGNTGRSVGVITRGLVIFQIGMTSLLLVSALLLAQSILRQQTVNYGYDTGAVLGARLGLMEGDYPTTERRQVFYERLLRELRATSQFESAAFSNRFRMIFSGSGPVEIEGREYKSDSDRKNTQIENVSSGYFDVLGVKLLEGRDFTDKDTDQREAVAIVNATFAKIYFPGQSALGHRIRTTQQNGTTPSPWRLIVGVVGNVMMQGPFDNKSDGSGFYVPFFASAFGPALPIPQAQQFGTIIVKPRGGQRPEALGAALQNVVNKVDANLPLYWMTTPRSAIDGFLAQNRILAVMVGAFGVIAVLLASVGLYGVMSFAVNQRTQEFGIRTALGADSSRILRMVFMGGVTQLAIGLLVGLGGTLLLAVFGREAIANVLFAIKPWDPFTYLAVALLLSLVSAVAMWMPARRATKVDPMIALRSE